MKKELLEPEISCERAQAFSLEECQSSWAAIIACEGSEQMIKQSPKRRVYTISIGPAGDKRVLVKQFVNRNLMGSLKDLVRAKPARRAWNAVQRAVESNIPTAAPLALIENGRSSEFYFLMEFLEGWNRLDLTLRDGFPDQPGPSHRSLKRSLLLDTSRAVRSFHDAGGDQPDFVAGNIMVREISGAWDVRFIDLDAADFGTEVGLSLRLKALGQLDAALRPYLTRAERIRGLKAYCGEDEDYLTRESVKRILAVSDSRV